MHHLSDNSEPELFNKYKINLCAAHVESQYIFKVTLSLHVFNITAHSFDEYTLVERTVPPTVEL